jgi:hypothetical protein
LFKEVRHVPDPRKNLISLGKLAREGKHVPLLDTLLMILVIAYGIIKITKSLGVEMSYSMRRSCTKINCRERNKKRKTRIHSA